MKSLNPSLPVHELVDRAFQNTREFNLQAFNTWLTNQSDDIKTLAKVCPPNLVYRLTSTPNSNVLCVIDGYSNKLTGRPALVIVRPLGLDATLGVTADYLQRVDYREACRLIGKTS